MKVQHLWKSLKFSKIHKLFFSSLDQTTAVCNKQVLSNEDQIPQHGSMSFPNVHFKWIFINNFHFLLGSIQDCSICKTLPSQVMLLDCGHLCICSECITTFMATTRQCPICRLHIRTAHRAYFWKNANQNEKYFILLHYNYHMNIVLIINWYKIMFYHELSNMN